MFGTGQEPLVPCPALLCHTTRYLEERRQKREDRKETAEVGLLPSI